MIILDILKYKVALPTKNKNGPPTKSASFAAAANSELTCLKSIHGLPHPFSTTIKGTKDEFSFELSVLIIASTSKPPASAARLRISQCYKQKY